MGLGRVVKTKIGTSINQDLKAVYPNRKITNDFLFWTLIYSGNKLKKMGNGSTVSGIRLENLRNMVVDMPDLEAQAQISSILSTYNGLIENNEMRIRIMEEMAQRLYTEWFVKFKFPGHEKVKMVDSPLGKIPEGWKLKKIKEVGKVITGKTPSTSKLDYFNGEILFIKTPDLHGNIFILDTEQTLSELGAKSQALKLLPDKTVFVSCIGTLGIVGITSKPSQTNQQINAVVANEKDDYCMLYFFVKSLRKQLIGLGSNGATMGNVNKDKFENIKTLYPDKKIRDEFFRLTSIIFDEILNLEKQIKTLVKTRDLLIPQLVTGRRILQ